MRFGIDEIREVVGGTVDGPAAAVDGVGIDSRELAEGSLFVALVAERDGHDFIPAAVSAGAGAHLVSDPGVGRPAGATFVRVDDTARALARLGAHARNRLPDRVVGVTGSVGKTSLKDLLSAVGATTWATAANPGSFNNELGVPLTLANAADGTELAIVEMGARGPGHIDELCRITRPTVGVVTVVADAHLELFESLEGVAAAKAELVEALPVDGHAILNADDRRVAAMAERTAATVLTYGTTAGEVRAERIRLDEQLRPRFRLVGPWGSVEIALGVSGAHQVINALGAATAAFALGAEPDAIAVGLASGSLSAHRMSLLALDDGLRILDDSYNANPTSMLAALDALAELPAGRRIAVLGTMAELGPDGDAAHRGIAVAAAERGIELVAVAEPAYGVTGERAVATVEEAARLVGGSVERTETVVLVKASRSAGLERVVELLRAPQAPRPG